MRFATHFGLQQYLELWTPECSKKDSSLEDLPSFNCYDTPLKPNAEDAFELVASQAPDVPVFLLRPHRLLQAAKWFCRHFPGEVLYAVKANPSPEFVKELWKGGVRGFDVASLEEVKLVSSLFPNARLAFMHPMKNRSVISEAYARHGVRTFVLDSMNELEKIRSATNYATDLTLIVRFMVSNYGSSLPLTGKFGVSAEESTLLLREVRQYAHKMGISFHVGSQSMKPMAYDIALSCVAAQIENAGDNIAVDFVDVGGGFPSVYDMEAPPPLDEYMAAITTAVKRLEVFSSAVLWCEPGRALSAEGEGLLTRIEGTKVYGDKKALYLNDGSFGALYDVVHEQWKYPVRVVTASGSAIVTSSESELVPYVVYGPTCDSADRFPEPLMLPPNLAEGDYLEWGNIGAYGRSMATRFNGFGLYETVTVKDSPWPSLYNMPCTGDVWQSIKTLEEPMFEYQDLSDEDLFTGGDLFFTDDGHSAGSPDISDEGSIVEITDEIR